MAQTERNKLNCHKDFSPMAHQFKADLNILEKIKLSFQFEPKPIGDSTMWINSQMATLLAICDAYKVTTEQEFSTTAYLAEIDKVNQWQLDFIAACTKFVAAAKTAPTKNGKPEPDKPTKDAADDIGKELDKLKKGVANVPDNVKHKVSGKDANKSKTLSEMFQATNLDLAVNHISPVLLGIASDIDSLNVKAATV